MLASRVAAFAKWCDGREQEMNAANQLNKIVMSI